MFRIYPVFLQYFMQQVLFYLLFTTVFLSGKSVFTKWKLFKLFFKEKRTAVKLPSHIPYSSFWRFFTLKSFHPVPFAALPNNYFTQDLIVVLMHPEVLEKN